MSTQNSIITSQINAQDFSKLQYKDSDVNLIAGIPLDTSFDIETDYIESYIYDETKTLIHPLNTERHLSFNVKGGDVLLNPQLDLENLGLDVGIFSIVYNFYRNQLASNINNKYFISEISSDRTEIRLDSNVISDEILVSSTLSFINQRQEADYFLDFQLNFGNNKLIIANNVLLDNETSDNPTILIKLYNPLPAAYDLNDELWVVETISNPQAYSVDFPFIPTIEDNTVSISPPNFHLDVNQQVGNVSESFNYNELLDANGSSDLLELKSILTNKGIKINVDYNNLDEFIHFSSGKTRLENFIWKVTTIQDYEQQIQVLLNPQTVDPNHNILDPNTASITILEGKIEELISNFDGYEYFLYYDSNSSNSYPKTTSPLTLLPVDSSSVTEWKILQAERLEIYDSNNKDRLYNTIPAYLTECEDNDNYGLFIDMVAQHYDNIWLYTKDITNKFDGDNRLNYGISKDMVSEAVRDFGIKLYSNKFQNDDLYTAFLGTLDVNSDDLDKSIHKRIYHNSPYLLKSKGTVAGLRALISSYGIPDTILRINEFGGKNIKNVDFKEQSQNISNYALDTGVSGRIISDFRSSGAFLSKSPLTIQFRFKAPTIDKLQNKTKQIIFNTTQDSNNPLISENSLLTLEYNVGVFNTTIPNYSPDPDLINATVKFFPSKDTPTENLEITLPILNDDWWSFQITFQNPDINNTLSNVELLGANSIDGKIGHKFSDSGQFDVLFTTASQIVKGSWNPKFWNTTESSVVLGGNTYYPMEGYLQEIRYWNTNLSEESFNNFVLNPYSIEGESDISTRDTLFFRAPLGTYGIPTKIDLPNDDSKYLSQHPRSTGEGSDDYTSFFDKNRFTLVNPTFEHNTEIIYQNQSNVGVKNRTTDHIYIVDNNLSESPYGSNPSAKSLSSICPLHFVDDSESSKVDNLEVSFSPTDYIDDDITAQIGSFNIGDYIGDPSHIRSQELTYPDLNTLRDIYFSKYMNSYNVVDFIDLIQHFDNSLFKMIKDFTPARTNVSTGVVIKQHILERNKQPQPITSLKDETYEGVVKSQPKGYTTGTPIYKFNGGTGGSLERYNNLEENNKFNLTQKTEVTISGSNANQITNETNFTKYTNFLKEDESEFYNGEFEGTNLVVTNQSLNPDCAPYLKVDKRGLIFKPLMFIEDINLGGQYNTITQDEFLNPLNSPAPGYLWIFFKKNINDILQPTHIKVSNTDANGDNISGFLVDFDRITLKLQETTVSNFPSSLEYSIKAIDRGANFKVLLLSTDITENSTEYDNNELFGNEEFMLSSSNLNNFENIFSNPAATSPNIFIEGYDIPSLEDPLNFFNPNTGIYTTKRTPNIPLKFNFKTTITPETINNVPTPIITSGSILEHVIYPTNATPQILELNNLQDSGSLIPSTTNPESTSQDILSLINPNNVLKGDDIGASEADPGGNPKISEDGDIELVLTPASNSYLTDKNISSNNFNGFFETDISYTTPVVVSPSGEESGAGNFSWVDTECIIDLNNPRCFTNSLLQVTEKYSQVIYGNFTSSFGGIFLNQTLGSTSTSDVKIPLQNIIWRELLGSGSNSILDYDIFNNITYNSSPLHHLDVKAEIYIKYKIITSENKILNITIPNIISNDISSSVTTVGPIPTTTTVDLLEDALNNFSNNTNVIGPPQSPTTLFEETSGSKVYEDTFVKTVSTPMDVPEVKDYIKDNIADWCHLQLFMEDVYPTPPYLSYQVDNFEVELRLDIQQNNDTPFTKSITLLKSIQGGNNRLETPLFNPENLSPTPTADLVMRLMKKQQTSTSSTTLFTSIPTQVDLNVGVNYLPLDFSNFNSPINISPSNKGDMYYFEYEFSNYTNTNSITSLSAKITPISTSTSDLNNEGHHVSIVQEIGGSSSLSIEPKIELYKGDNMILSSTSTIISTSTPTNLDEDFTYNSGYEAGDEFKIKFSAIKNSGNKFTLSNTEFNISPYYVDNVVTESIESKNSNFHLPTYFGAGNLPFNFAHDCQPTYNNYVDSRPNSKLMEVDYSLNSNEKGSLFPSNMNSILNNTATKAQIPDSNYTTIAHTSLRYEGTKTSNQYINEWSPKDLGTYGKLPAVELKDAYFGYFNDLSDPYPLLNGKTRVNLNFLIDGEGNAIPPSLDDVVAKSILESTFPLKGTARLSVTSGNVELQGLNDLKPIYSIGKMPVPIVYTQTSSTTFASEIEFEGEGRISMYDDPSNVSYIKDYSFNATGEGYSNPSFPNNRDIEITLSPSEVKYKEYDGSTTNATLLPYNPNTGIFKFNDESSVNNSGSDTSQDHYMDLETSITSTYLYDGDYNKNGSFWRKHKHEERLEMSLKLWLEYSTDDFNSLSQNLPYNFEDLMLKIHFLDGSYQDVGSVSDKVKFIQSQSNKKSPQGDKNSPLYKYSKGVGIPLNKKNQIEIQIDNDIVKDIIKEKGLGNEEGIQTDGKITGLEWVFKANSGENRYEKDSSLRWKIQGNMISDIKNASNNTFYPGNLFPKFPTNLTLQGAKSNIFNNDNKTGSEFWRFAHEINSSLSHPHNYLYMKDPNFNEAYGTSFKQKALNYTPGNSDYFPGGDEPIGTSIGNPHSNIEFKVGDEIRFNNNENHSYTILNIVPPANSTEVGDLKGKLKIELDRDLPDTSTFNKDFFLIRRYIPNINSVYLDSPFPYGTLTEAQTTPGILYPDYPTDYLKDNASNIIIELTDKGIIK